MPWLRCQVEHLSRKSSAPIVGEFEGRSVYECAWLALCHWAMSWFFDSAGAFLAVKCDDRAWVVRKDSVSTWRTVVRSDAARQMIHEARLRDPEGKERL